MAHACHVNTGKLKDKVSNTLMASFRRSGELQPPRYPNFPEDFKDDCFKMFGAETKVEKWDKTTNQFKGYMRRLSFGQPNRAFGTYVYNLAALETAAEAFCREAPGLPALGWDAFRREIKRTGKFHEEPARADQEEPFAFLQLPIRTALLPKSTGRPSGLAK
jgi:phage terminase large subunit GpA-like protein